MSILRTSMQPRAIYSRTLRSRRSTCLERWQESTAYPSTAQRRPSCSRTLGSRVLPRAPSP
eukprot:6195232-Pleurochrysis_carterae.AAC.1